ncbi:MAG: hypothetical protein FJ265_18615 [Planctomycetes bacterium]|nr:hypothetical protein [Planctomycetota bacterium]
MTTCVRAVLLPCAALAACLGSAPPAPAVRWFDPLPAAAPGGRLATALRVTAPPYLGREIAVRVRPRELVFDPLHGWIDAPRELVAIALRRALGPIPAGTGAVRELEVFVAAFEADLTAEPRAHVRLELRWPGEPVHEVDSWAPAVGRSPEQLAAAMATALASAVAETVRVR